MYLRFMKQDWVSKQRMPIIGAKTAKTIQDVRKYAINSYENPTDFIRLIGMNKDAVSADRTIGIVINSSAGYLFGFQTLHPNDVGYDPFGRNIILYSWNDYVKNGGGYRVDLSAWYVWSFLIL